MRRVLFDLTMLLAFLFCIPHIFAQMRSSESTRESTGGVLNAAGALGHRAVDATTRALDSAADKLSESAGPAARKAAAGSRSAWERGKDWVSAQWQSARAWWTSPSKARQ